MGWVLAIGLLAGGCGFHSKTADLGGADLTGIDLAGADLSGIDLAHGLDQGSGMTGAGPLGALPTGFCCSSNEQCRSRHCNTTGSGPAYCADDCADTVECSAWSSSFVCDQTMGICIPSSASYTCLDPSQYPRGSKPLGACCASGFPKSGQECLGGRCESTGNDANPFYCSQGCDQMTPCPGGYSCAANFCWITQTLSDPNFMYMCQ